MAPLPQRSNSEESKWLSMSEAALLVPYSAEYLSLLARKGKLSSKKIGNTWYTTKVALEDYMQRQMIRTHVQNGSFQSVANLGGKKESEKPAHLLRDEVPLRQLRSFRTDTDEYINNSGVLVEPIKDDESEKKFVEKKLVRNITAPTATSDLSPKKSERTPVQEIEHMFERVLEKRAVGKKAFHTTRVRYKTIFSSRVLIAATIAAALALTIFPVPVVFSFFEKSFTAIKETIKDSNTVMGFRPGTHANEILLLDKNGNVAIMGHIETEGQLRSYVASGTAPLVVDSTTKVENLNADSVDGVSSEEFTLAFVTANGNVTTEDVYLEGNVEVGQTLKVKGATKLLSTLQVGGDLKVFGDAEFARVLRVVGPAYFDSLLTARSGIDSEGDISTDGNLSVRKNINVRGSVEVGSSVLAKGGSFGYLGVRGDFSAGGKVTLGNEDDEIVINSENFTLDKSGNAIFSSSVSGTSIGATNLTSTNSTSTNATSTNLYAENANFGNINSGAIVLTGLNFTNATGTSATTTNFYSENVSFANLSLSDLVVTNLEFANATGTNATTTTFYSQFVDGVLARITSIVADDVSVGALTTTNSTTTSATTTNLAVNSQLTTNDLQFTNATGTNLFSTTASSTDLYSTNANLGIVVLGNATSSNFFSDTASSTNLFSMNFNLGTGTIGDLTATTINAGELTLSGSTTLQNFTFVNATGTSATTTSLYSQIFNSQFATFNQATSTNFQTTNLEFTNATGTNATTTSFAIAGLTSGRIPFVTTGGALIDSSLLTFDSTVGRITAPYASSTSITTTGSSYFATSGGNVGVGTTSPMVKFSVGGAAGDTSGHGYFTGGLGVGVVNTTAGTIETSGDVTVGGALTINGSAVSSATTGQFTFLAIPIGAAIDEGTIYINPLSAGTNNVLLGVAVNGTEKLRVDAEGDVQIVGTFNSSSPAGTNQLSGHLSVLGDTTIGSDASDTLTVNSYIDSDLVPSSDISFDLGTPTKKWANFYAANAYFDNVTINGATTTSFIINSENSTFDTEDSTLEFSRGSSTPNAILKWNSTDDQFEFNDFPVYFANSIKVGDSASSTIAGQLILTGTPLGTGIGDGSLYINPSVGPTNNTLFSIAVAGVERFKVDAEGDTTVQASLGIENQLYDISGDTLTINDKLQINGDEIKDSSGTTRITLGATNTLIGLLDITGSSIDFSAPSAVLNFSSATGVKTIQTGGTTDLNFAPGGNVGVGDSTPTYKLDVNGTGRFTDDLTLDSDLIVAGNSTTTNATTTSFFSTTGTFTNLFADSLNLTDLTFINATGTNATTTNLAVSSLVATRIPFATTGGALIDSSLLTFDSSVGKLSTVYASTTALTSSGSAYFATGGGNVGIGTTTPGQFLDVQGAAQFGTNNINLVDSVGKITGLSSTYFNTDTSDNLATILTDETGSGGGFVRATAPTVTTLTVSSGGVAVTGNSTITGTLSSLTGLTSSGAITFSSLTANRLVSTNGSSALTNTISSANLYSSVSDPTGTAGSLVFSASPTFTGTANFSSILTSASSTLQDFTAVNATTTQATTTSLAISSLTSGRIPFATTGGALIDSSLLTFDSSVGKLSTVYASTTALTSSGSAYFATGGGNVGIGLETPTSYLHVYENNATAASNIHGLTLEQAGTGDTYIQWLLTGTRRWVAGVDNSDSDKFKIANTNSFDSSTLFTIDNNGNVGIGTTTVNRNLVVNENGQSEISLRAGASSIGYLLFGNQGSDDLGRIGYDNSSNSLNFWTNSGNRMTINSSGNVGVGVTEPGARLAVNKANSGTTVGSGIAQRIQGAATANARTELGFSYDSALGTYSPVLVGYQLTTFSGYTSGSLYFATRNVTTDTAPTERMTILPGGNVGIGDTSPTDLFVVGSGDLFRVNSSGAIAAATGITSSGSINFSGLTASRMVFTDGSTNLSSSANSATIANSISDETGSGALVFASSPIIDAPTISGTVNISGLTGSRLVATDGSKNLTSSITAANLQSSVSGTTGSGNLVFATTPTFSTSVVTGSSSFDLFNDTATTLNFGGAATALNIGASTGTTTINNGLIVGGTDLVVQQATGNVGLGTTDPRSALHVGKATTGTSVGDGLVARLESANTTNARTELGFNYFGSPASYNPALIGFQLTSATGYGAGSFYIATRDVDTDTAPTERFTILSDGSVGVNDTTPTYRLDVNGTGRFTGNLTVDSNLSIIGNATSTNLFATTASSTSLFSTNFNLGVGSLGSTTANSINTSALTIGSLTGPLQSVNGVVSASSTLAVAYGGTGANSFTSGLLVGNGANALISRVLTGTSDRITITNGNGVSGNPTFDIASSYVGQSSITTVGVLNSGSITSGFGSVDLGSDTFTTTGLGTFGEILATSSSTLQNFTFLNATGTAITTTGSAYLALNGGNVGIGEEAPTSLLHLKQPTDDFNGGVRIEASDSTEAAFIYRQNTANDALIIRNNGTDTIAIENGLVGIGTDSPGYKLNIQGTTGTAASARFEATGADSNAFLVVDNDASGWTFGINGGNSDAFQINNAFGFASGNKFTILTGGNVGIGTTNPGALLELNPTSTLEGVKINGTSSGNLLSSYVSGDLRFYVNNDGNLRFSSGGGSSVINEGAGRLSLGVDNSEDLTIITGGNVGIGTTSPSGKFEVYGTGGVTATLTSASDSANAQLLFRTGATPANRYFLGVDTDDSNKFKISYNSAPGGAGDLFTLTSGGLVGLGTVSPVTTLEVAKDVSAYPTTGTYGQLNLIGNSVETKILSLGYNTTADKGFIQAFVDGTAFRDLVLNPNGGLLGVRTTNPQKTLHVAGSGRFENDVEFYETDAGNAAVLVDVSSTYGIIDVLRGGVTVSRISGADSGSTASFINNGGNFGIGTTTPANKLEVYGANPYIAADASSGNPGIKFLSGSGEQWRLDSSTANGHRLRVLNAGAATEVLSIIQSGNVGIGDTTPTEANLVVNGTALFTGALAAGDTVVKSYNSFGSNSTSHSLSSANDLLITGNLEVDGSFFLDGGSFSFDTASTTGDIEIGGVVLASDGSNTNPSYTFKNDTDTGIYRAGTNDLRLVTGGSDRLNISSSGVINISNLTASRFVLTDSSKNLVNSGASSVLANTLTDETGSSGGVVVFSSSPSVTGILDAEAGDFSSTLTLSGSSANIALGSNWLSGDGNDEGVFIDSSGKVGVGTSTTASLDANSKAIGLTVQGGISLTNDTSVSFRLSNSLTYYPTIQVDSANSLNFGDINNVFGGVSFYSGGSSRAKLDTSGNLGIGSSTPVSKLAVHNGNVTLSEGYAINFDGGGGTPSRASIYSPSTDILHIRNQGVDRIVIDANAVNVADHLFPGADNSFSLGSGSKRFTDVYAVSGVVNTSDAREKSNVNTSDLGLEFVNGLRPISYIWTDPSIDQETYYGFLAQDIEELLAGKSFAGLVYDADSDKYGLRYTEFIAPVVRAVQELSGILDETKLLIENISDRLAVLESTTYVASSTTGYLIEQLELGATLSEATSTVVVADRSFEIYNKFTLLVDKTLNKLGIVLKNGVVMVENFAVDMISAKVAIINDLSVDALTINDKLCVDGVCLDREQLKALLQERGGSTSNNQATSTNDQTITNTTINNNQTSTSTISATTTTPTSTEPVVTTQTDTASSTDSTIPTTTEGSVGTPTESVGAETIATTTEEVTTTEETAATTPETVTTEETTPTTETATTTTP